MRKILAGATLALGVLIALPHQADAQTSVWTDQVCAEASFNPCVDFELFVSDADPLDYFFRTTYLGSLGDPEGKLTAAGLYDIDGSGTPWSFTNVTLIQPTENWTFGDDGTCDKLSGGGNVLFEGCAQGDNGINYGVDPGGYVEFSFTSNYTISSSDFAYYDENGDLQGGDLGARAMIQGVDDADCSYKLDSPQGFVSGCTGPVVPEPMTMVLLSTGLLGIGAVGVLRRREEEQEEV